ncbi:methylglyoxal synthase [Spartinivicinus ruber]|uniref:methylglyoxal synthase n=1 Tax=Spartinivicinus ruber TaxID=2683272 RepID=UPI0013D4255E|nr:methylglyoxal synthase [Spartinivicinus ruber]
MKYTQRHMNQPKHIALVAHDNKKKEMLAWVSEHAPILEQHQLYATGTTGALLEHNLDLTIEKLISGPLGGDQQVGSLITDGNIDMLIFFWDPFEPLPHDPDVKALLRIAAVWNIPVACNQASADFLISSPLIGENYTHSVPDYEHYRIKRRHIAETN